MKNCIYILFFSFIACSCDPGAGNEGVNPDLPSVMFAFNVSPDTAYVKVGDTITLYSSISSTLSNGVKLKDGDVYIDASLYYFDTFPITNNNQISVNAKSGNHYTLLVENGDIQNNTADIGSFRGLTTQYENDSFVFKYKFILNKSGLFWFHLGGNFLNCSIGKTYAGAEFNMINTHWNFIQINGEENPLPNSEEYYSSYRIAVTE